MSARRARGELEAAAARVRLLRVTLELPRFRIALPRPPATGFAWSEPGRDLAFWASGAVTTVATGGAGRFATVASCARELAAHCDESRAADVPDDLPLWVGGFAFDPTGGRSEPWRALPAAWWWVPETLLVRRGGRSWAVLTVRTDRGGPVAERIAELESRLPTRPDHAPEGADPAVLPAPTREAAEDRARFCERVRDARDAVRRGALEKLVVARAVRLEVPRELSIDAVLSRLDRNHAASRQFAVRRGATTFLGSSPERLVSVHRGEVRVDALAGTAPRSDDALADEAFARGLRESKKEQEEHAVVVRALHDALAPLCHPLHAPEAPAVRRFATVQHLHTPIRGRLREPRPFSILEIAERLHPTPAVAGAPQHAALAWLRRHERIDRGWYAGLVGWLDSRGDGDLAVALRSALLRPGVAWLHAGAGIVAGSEPEAELAETDLKLRTMRDAFAGARR